MIHLSSSETGSDNAEKRSSRQKINELNIFNDSKIIFYIFFHPNSFLLFWIQVSISCHLPYCTCIYLRFHLFLSVVAISMQMLRSDLIQCYVVSVLKCASQLDTTLYTAGRWTATLRSQFPRREMMDGGGIVIMEIYW